LANQIVTIDITFQIK